MKFWVGLTDYSWFKFLAAEGCDEVNFWKPRPRGRSLAAATPGMPYFFKLKRPHHAIAGGGFWIAYWTIPLRLAWETFGRKNGAASLSEFAGMVQALGHSGHLDAEVGCHILANPFFLPEEQWVPVAPKPGVMVGEFNDSQTPPGEEIWRAMSWHFLEGPRSTAAPSLPEIADQGPRYGDATLIHPRLGQGAFRALVTDAYRRRCAMTGESTLFALEAAHIVPYSENGSHEVRNGMLLRADFHRLYDAGLVGVTPEMRIRVSPRIRESWFNGKVYYRLEGQQLQSLPEKPADRPDRDLLDWHMTNRFQA